MALTDGLLPYRGQGAYGAAPGQRSVVQPQTVRVCSSMSAAAVFVWVALTWFLVVAPPAAAFDRDALYRGCQVDTRWQFSGSLWIENAVDRRPAGRAAINEWRMFLDSDGVPLANPIESSMYSPVNVVWVENPGNNPVYDGYADCDGRSIQLKLAIRGDEPRWTAVLRHEFGHILGLQHTGSHDSFDTVDSTGQGTTLASMSTCVEQVAQRLAQDDGGSLIHLNGAGSLHALHPDASFEVGVGYWGRVGGSISRVSGGPDGLWSATWSPNTADNVLYQTANFVSATGVPVDAALWYRTPAAATHGAVLLQVWLRQVSYPAPNPASCGYNSGLDQNARLFQGGWVKYAESLSGVSNTWRGASTQLFGIPSWNAADVRVQVVSQVKSASGTLQQLYVDNVRARGN